MALRAPNLYVLALRAYKFLKDTYINNKDSHTRTHTHTHTHTHTQPHTHTHTHTLSLYLSGQWD